MPEQTDPTFGTAIEQVVADEVATIEMQRKNRGVAPNPARRMGLALSGGGIRSASFCLGVLQALARKGRLVDVDYLSTVSGGGYIGAALTWFQHGDAMAGAKPAFPFGEKGQSRCSAVTEEGASVEVEPDRTAFIRQHGEYLAPSRQITKTSLIGAVLRNALVSFGVYGALVVAFTQLILQSADVWSGWLVVKAIGKIVPTSFGVSASFAVVFAALSLVFALLTWFYPKFLPKSKQLYSFRIVGQQVLGWVLGVSAATFVLGTIGPAVRWLDHWNAAGGLGALFTSTGVVGVAFEFVKQHRPQIARLWPKLNSLTVWVAGGALIYGLLLLSYVMARSFVNHDYESLPWILIGSAILFGGLMNSNMFNISRMYRDRLTEAFLPDKATVESGMWKPAYEADVAFLSDVCGPKHPGPFHLINTNAVLTSSDFALYRGRGGSNFVMSSLYCGSEATGWHLTREFIGGNMTLATAMAISGAAVNPNAACGGQGPTRNRLASFMLALFNVRLGYWVRNPHAYPRFGKLVSYLWPNLLYPGLRQGLLGTGAHVRAGFLELTDGGHFDNTGLYELVRRRVRVIVLALASADPQYGYDDLADVLERVRADFGVYIWFEDLLAGTTPGSCAKPPGGIAAALKLCERGHAVGTILYPGDEEPGSLIVLKAAATAKLPMDVLRYAATHEDYPNETTADQFFDERQFEAYRETGYAAAKGMLEENGLKGWF